MKDATNYINNIDKPVEEQTFLLAVTGKELKILRAIFQNPHDNYQSSTELMTAAEQMFHETKYMLEKSERHNQDVDFSELGCPPGCTSPFCSCPGTD